MFGKTNKKTSYDDNEPLQDVTQPDMPEEETVSKAGSKRSTIIAKDTIINGNIEVNGDIQVYGEIIGNINLHEGSIRVMQSGHVNGELKSPVIIIDGQVDGTCCAKTIDILDHGKLKGISRCESLSIKQGGTFIGQSEKTDEMIKDNARISKFVSPNSIENAKSQKETIMNTSAIPNLPVQANKK